MTDLLCSVKGLSSFHLYKRRARFVIKHSNRDAHIIVLAFCGEKYKSRKKKVLIRIYHKQISNKSNSVIYYTQQPTHVCYCNLAFCGQVFNNNTQKMSTLGAVFFYLLVNTTCSIREVVFIIILT